MIDESETPRLPAGALEALEMLLPGVDRAERDEAERVAGFLRLLQSDAGRASEGVSVDLAHARDDLARSGRLRLEGALHDLCAHHLAALLGPDRFLSPGVASASAAEAWRQLEGLREEYDGLAELPAPNEAVSTVAARLVESLARHSGEGAAGLWHARLVAALRGPHEGETAFRALLHDADDGTQTPDTWAGTIACLLDRGAVHPATSLVVEGFAAHPSDARLGRLLVWCHLLSGDVVAARALEETLGHWDGVLPGVLMRLRREQPAWLPMLSGRAPVAASHAPDCDARLERAACGAQLIALLQLHPGSGPELIAFDATAALRPRVEQWCEAREGAAARPGTPEHRLLRDARSVAWHRGDESALEHSLGGQDSRAALLQPILDDAGETCGWLRVECSHHLLPSPARMESLARAWRAELLRRRGRWETPAEERAWAEPATDREGVARCFHELVTDLGIKTARRAWWGIEVAPEGPQLVARGGDGLDPLGAPTGQGRALRRALACGGPVRAEEPDVGLYLHAHAAAGVVLCLRIADRCIGALAIESERRRDFGESETARLAQAVDRWSLPLRHAQFRSEHEARFGKSVLADAHSPGFRRFHAALARAAAGSVPLVLVGPAGAGKRVFARWAWFESDSGTAPRDELAVEDWLAEGGARDAYIEGVERLDARGQSLLLRTLEHTASPRRVCFGTREDPGVAAREGRLAPELATLLCRERLSVPGFAQRRDELPQLVSGRITDLALELGRCAPQLDDDAMAFLWRQDWPGNWRELDGRLHELLRRVADTPVSADELAALWRSMGDVPLLRLPSRRPAAALLRSALDTTATAGGRANKRRAALYLGWDPDTIQARLADAELRSPAPESRGDAWSGVER